MAKHLASLLQQSTIDDHEEILQACNAALKQSKSTLESQHARFIALLKLDRYEEALQVLEDEGDNLKQKAKVEWAYALYKSGSLQEAVDVAKNVQVDRGARHVEAQASYRSEDFNAAAAVYTDLASRAAGYGNEGSDIEVNRGATEAQLGWSGKSQLGQKKKYTREDLEAFETAYNAGCTAVAKGEYREAEFLLKTAAGLCASSDELTEQEKTAEILPIKVQQLYLYCQIGKTSEAETLASEISAQHVSDPSTKQIAHANIQAASSTVANPFASERVSGNASVLSKSDDLFRFQSDAIERNELTMDLLAFRSAAVIKATERAISKETPTISARINSLSALNAAAHAQSQLAKLGLKHILPLFSRRPADIGLAMTIIQLYMLTSNLGAAANVLESLLKNLSKHAKEGEQEDILNAPGLVALQVSLFGLQNRTSHVKSVLAKASSYWRHKSKNRQDEEPTALLRAAGASLLESPLPGHQTEAQGIFSSLHSRDPSSPFATAGFVAAHAITSPSSVKKEAETLPKVPELISSINIDALEAAGVPTAPSKLAEISAASKIDSTTTASRKRRAQQQDKTQPPPRKRIRKSRLPKKDYDPAKPPDPERWLPLRERSYYRPPKGKKARKKAEEKTQGGITTAEDGGSSGPQKSEVGVVIGGEGESKGGGGGGGGKGKGKKKGKR